jgi:predicted O-methyltransferase YrrM
MVDENPTSIMSNFQTPISDELAAYIRSVSLREPDILRRLREETASRPDAMMQLSPEQGQFLGMLVHLTGARRTIEVGVFTGLSALHVALALPPDGQIVACDVNAETTAIARRYWSEAGVAEKIDLRIAPAAQTLDALVQEGAADSFDFAFVDADKENYQHYYELVLKLLRPGGLAAFDNVLWHGRVIDDAVQDADTRAIRAFNANLHLDNRVWLSLVPLGDGLTLACKR